MLQRVTSWLALFNHYNPTFLLPLFINLPPLKWLKGLEDFNVLSGFRCIFPTTYKYMIAIS